MEQQPARSVWDTIEGLLDGVDPAAVPRGDRLAVSLRARGLASRLSAMASVLLARADQTQESMQATGTPTTSWLTLKGGLSKREAAGALHQARELAARPGVADAAASGSITVGQARAISSVMSGLDGLDEEQQGRAERLLLELAGGMDSDQLAKAAPQVFAQVIPERANEALERRLQREAEAAHRNRALRFFRDGESVRFDGSLPRVEAEQWMTQLDAHAESRRRTAIEERDPLAARLTPEQRRADALSAMIRAHAAGKAAPRTGGDRPRIIVTLDYDQLLAHIAGAGVLAGDQPLSAGELRRLCCDADLLPAVLGGPSQVLDVGRDHRLVTPAIRAALVLRDRGCAFPGCHTRPSACEAHHVTPWWDGGATTLSNLVLLCHHHHALVEPARYGVREQWQIRIAEDGIPEAIPPPRYTSGRTPVRHARYLPAAA